MEILCEYCIVVHFCGEDRKYKILEGMGAYGPLLLAPAEGLGGPSGPLPCWGNLFLIIYGETNPGKSIDI